MNYSKKWKSSILANLQIKLDRIERPIVLPAKPTSQPYKHFNKIQCRYELQISAKAKSQIEQKSIVILSVVVSQPVTSIVYHGSFGMSLCSSVSLQESSTAHSSHSTVVASE